MMDDDYEYKGLSKEDIDRIRAKHPERFAEIERELNQRFQEADRNTQTYGKAEVGKSILFSIIGVVAFYICLFVLTIGITMLFALIFKIPVISHWVSFIFKYRGDSPDIIIKLASVILSVLAVSWMIRRFCNIHATKKLSMTICGAILFVMNIVFLVQNILEAGDYSVNVLIMIFAIVMIGTSGS